MAFGHMAVFQGWNDGNPGSRDKAAAHVLGGVSQECLVSAFLQLFCQVLVLQGSVELKACSQRSGLKSRYTSVNSWQGLFPSAPPWHRTFFCFLNDTKEKYGLPCHYLEELERWCWGNTVFLN